MEMGHEKVSAKLKCAALDGQEYRTVIMTVNRSVTMVAKMVTVQHQTFVSVEEATSKIKIKSAFQHAPSDV